MLKRSIPLSVRMTLTLGLLLGFFGGAAALDEAFSRRKVAFTEFDLANGLHVIMHQDNSTPIVNVSIMYRVGSKDEREGRTGFAHFFEHLMFEGSKNIGRGEFGKYVQNAGGTLNANTSYDRTYYYENLPSNQLELGLWLESERMLHAIVDSAGIDTQREVVKEERRQRIDNQPYGKLLSETMERVYKVHSYKEAVIGSLADLNAAQEDDFVDFYATYYVPNNAVLVITGDIELDQTQKLVEQYFGEIAAGENEIKRKNDAEPEQMMEIRDVTYDPNIRLPAVIHAYRTIPLGHEDYYAVDMLNQVLSQGESSRMQKNIVNTAELAIAAGSFNLGLSYESVSLAYAISNMGTDVQVLDSAINAEYERVRSELISEEEMQKLRNQVESDILSEVSSVSSIGNALADYYTFWGDANLINTRLDEYMKVTREDIQRVAQKYFTPDRRVVLFYMPENQ